VGYATHTSGIPVGKIWHCILGAELTKTHSFRLFFWRLGYAACIPNCNQTHDPGW